MAEGPFTPSSSFQSQQKKLFCPSQADPLLLSPLSFQTNFSSHTQFARSPVSRFQHGPSDRSPCPQSLRRSMPPSDLSQLRLSDHSSWSPRSEDEEDGRSPPRRRSLPPSIHSSVSSYQRSEVAPSLWSVHEESLHEPMDISPDKALLRPDPLSALGEQLSASSLSLRRQGTGSTVSSISRDSASIFGGGKPSDSPLTLKRQGTGSQASSSSCDYSENSASVFGGLQRSESPLTLKRQGTGAGAPSLRRLNAKKTTQGSQQESSSSSSSQITRNNQSPTSEEVSRDTQKASPEDQQKRGSGRGWVRTVSIMIIQLVGFAGIVVASMLGVDVYSYWCQHYEAINSTQLSHTLSERVYGQHVAVSLIPAALEVYGHGTRPPLVLSLHGWTGVGKNHVSFLISEHLRRGEAHKLISTLHFPHKHQDYTQLTEDMVYSRLSKCQLNLFIVDEIDKAPASVVKALEGILTRVRSAEYRKENSYKIVFLLLSNTGASHINRYVFQRLRTHGEPREEIKHDALVNELLNAEKLGSQDFSWFSRLHRRGLIDVIVPFLPLERQHVEMCAAADMRAKGMAVTPTTLHSVVAEMTFGPADYPIFSVSGCRKVPTKVDVTEL